MRWGVNVDKADGGGDSCEWEGCEDTGFESSGDLKVGFGSVVGMVVWRDEEEGKMLLYIDIMAKDCSRNISM
jgi:hypothetical protein